MSQTGTVTKINPSRGMVAIATEDDGFTIIELTSESNVGVGDVITWNDDTALGREVYQNQTKGTRSEVFVQNHHVTKANLDRQLLLE